MKKALIVIISAIYVVAIIIVSFLGVRADVDHRVTYAEEIVLLNESLYYQGLPKVEDNLIIGVYKRPDESLINEKGVGIYDEITWNYNEGQSKRDYAIFIYDTNFVYNEMGKQYTLQTSVKPDDTTRKDLDYFLSGGDKTVQTLTINDVGQISFSVEYTGWVGVDIIISTTDLSNVEIDVLLKINKYVK